MEAGPSQSDASAMASTTPVTEGVRAAIRKRPRVPREAAILPPAAAEQTLRQFSLKVCQVVQQQGDTTYNEVADTLVNQIVGDKAEGSKPESDERNVRR